MIKLSKAQQRMIDRLASGKYIIGYMRNWYVTHNGEARFFGSKANDATIEVLLNAGILIEKGIINKTDYSIELTAK